MTVAALIEKIRTQLKDLPASSLEARRLLAHVLGVSTSEIFQHDDDKVDTKKSEWIDSAVQRRLAGEPLAYILESQGFYKSDFVVRKGVLVPRPETEFVVEAALRLFPHRPPDHFADLGCGSGCIGLSLLKEWRTSLLLAVDISETAIAITTENMNRLSLQNRCEVRRASVETQPEKDHFDLIVANPPYIAKDDEGVEENVKKFEPGEALYADNQGMAALNSWSAWAKGALKSGGWWITEIGAGQSENVNAKLKSLGFVNLGAKKDLAGHTRVLCAQKP
jgi:release factor glutamine methyltransferase